MNSFDYIAEARAIKNALAGEDLAEWQTRIADAIDTSSTGTEILVIVRSNLIELLKAKPLFPVDVVARIKDDILAANKLLS